MSLIVNLSSVYVTIILFVNSQPISIVMKKFIRECLYDKVISSLLLFKLFHFFLICVTQKLTMNGKIRNFTPWNICQNNDTMR